MIGVLLWIAAPFLLSTGIACLLIAKVFRRPIDHVGFVVCAVVVFLSGALLSTAFRRVGAVVVLCDVSLCLAGTLMIGFLVAWLIRRSHFSVGAVAVAVFITALFGLTTGYRGAWVYDFGDESTIWHIFPAAFGTPGVSLAELDNGGEWQGGEIWASREEIAMWNGLVWCLIGLTSGSVIADVTKKSSPSVAAPALSQSI